MAVRTLFAGAVCVCILAGMVVGHAWPLWTGQPVLLRVRPIDPRDLFRGEFVRFEIPATRLSVVEHKTPQSDGVEVRARGRLREPFDRRPYGTVVHPGSIVYVQLERRADGPEYQAVSVSDAPVEDALNLRGRVRDIYSGGGLHVSYGLDAFFMQEGTARSVEDALRAGRAVHIEVAVAESGRARVRRLLIDGVPAGRR